MTHEGWRPTVVRDDAELRLSTQWRWLMVRGLFTFAVGAGAFFFPLAAVYGLTVVFAAFAFADGLISVAMGVPRARRRHGPWLPLLFRGLIGILVGVGFVVAPVLATMSYTLVALAIVAAWAVTSGGLEISTALLVRKELSHEWLLMASGAVSILFGIAIVAVALVYPTGYLILAFVFAMYAMASGLMVTGQALNLRGIGQMGSPLVQPQPEKSLRGSVPTTPTP